ncbi:hypothetical protein CR513_60599, partial [Mucuna pruriens]
MLAHTTRLIAKMDPLKYIFEKPTLTGQIARRKMALSEYDILAYQPLDEYHPLLHEFLDERIMMAEKDEHEAELDEWKFWFNGASNLLGNRIGVVLASPKVIYQLHGEWETRDAKLVSYHAHIMVLSEHFDEISFYYVPWDKNQMIDVLTTLSAMLQAN